MSSSDEEDSYSIEKILGSREGDVGIEFHIKWLGFDASDNTWEKRGDLIADGLQDDVKKYESAQKKLLKAAEKAKDKKKKEKKTPAKPRGRKAASTSATKKTSNEEEDELMPKKQRARSQTPAGRKTKTKTPPSESEQEEEEEQAEEEEEEDAVESEETANEEDEGKEKESPTVAAPLSQPASYKDITLPESFSLSWVFLFVVTIISITVLRVVKDTDMKLLDADMQFNIAVATIVLEPMPALLAILAILRYASTGATLYSSRVCGALVWLVFVDVFEKIDTVIPGFFDQALSKEQMVLFSLCMLLGFYGYALSADNSPHSPIVGMLTVAASGVVLSYFDMNPTVAPIWIQSLVVILAFFLLARALVRLGYYDDSIVAARTLPEWLDLTASILLVFVVFIELLQLNGRLHMDSLGEDFKLGQPMGYATAYTGPDVEHLLLNPLWFLFSTMKWGICAALTCAALLDFSRAADQQSVSA